MASGFGIEGLAPRVDRRGLCATGLVFLAATVGDAENDKHSDYNGLDARGL